MLKYLGKFGKGWASIIGAVITVTGVLFGDTVAQNVAAINEGATQVVTSVGALLLAFGVGRKAGDAINK